MWRELYNYIAECASGELLLTAGTFSNSLHIFIFISIVVGSSEQV